jgi:hypothetical protein
MKKILLIVLFVGINFYLKDIKSCLDGDNKDKFSFFLISEFQIENPENYEKISKIASDFGFFIKRLDAKDQDAIDNDFEQCLNNNNKFNKLSNLYAENIQKSDDFYRNLYQQGVKIGLNCIKNNLLLMKQIYEKPEYDKKRRVVPCYDDIPNTIGRNIEDIDNIIKQNK